MLIALLLPLTLSISRRVDAEIKAESLGQVSLVATTAGDELNRPARLRDLVDRSAAALGGRVIVTDQEGAIVADSAGTGLGARITLIAPRSRPRSTARTRRDGGTASRSGRVPFTAAPVIENGRTVGTVRATQSVAAVNDAVRDDVLVLIGRRGGRPAVRRGGGVGARRHPHPAARVADRDRAACRRRGPRRPRARAGLARAATRSRPRSTR